MDVDAQSEGSTLQLDLEMHDDQGNFIAYGNTGDFGANYIEQMVETGTYYIVVNWVYDTVASDFYTVAMSMR